MTFTIKQCELNQVYIAIEQHAHNGVYHVIACQKHGDNLCGYPMYETYTYRINTAKSYYYYLRRKYK